MYVHMYKLKEEVKIYQKEKEKKSKPKFANLGAKSYKIRTGLKLRNVHHQNMQQRPVWVQTGV